jgi:hypothetical protein
MTAVGRRAVAAVACFGLGLLTPTASWADEASLVVADAPWVWAINEVSHDGRWLAGEGHDLYLGVVIVDRQSGAVTSEGPDESWWFVRDNPTLRVNLRTEEEYPRTAVYLLNTSTGVKHRIDTDSRGVALTPAWPVNPGHADDGDGLSDTPHLLTSEASISRDGRKVAFCANFVAPEKPLLYVKDVKTGRLTQTKVQCGASWEEYGARMSRPPEMSDDGKVVHINGDTFAVPPDGPTNHWLSDTLYFTGSGKVRRINGWGSMTRDGGTVFLRIGVHPKGTPDRTGGRVGAYNVHTGKVTRLPGTNAIYGNDVLTFSAFDQASRRGRFIVNQTSVIDRTYGVVTDISAMLRARGYEVPSDAEFPNCIPRRISSDVRVVIAGLTQGGCDKYVAVSGWEPAAQATVTTNASQSKLVVNVDPDRGSGYWQFRVQVKRADGSWRTLKKTYRTHGKPETRTLNLPAGTFRVQVLPKYGYQGSTSGEVLLAR